VKIFPIAAKTLAVKNNKAEQSRSGKSGQGLLWGVLKTNRKKGGESRKVKAREESRGENGG